MRNEQSYRIHYLLIIVCLGLLLSFLVFWNMDYYKQEEAQLETNSNLAFENIVRELEDALWIQRLVSNIDDSTGDHNNNFVSISLSQEISNAIQKPKETTDNKGLKIVAEFKTDSSVSVRDQLINGLHTQKMSKNITTLTSDFTGMISFSLDKDSSQNSFSDALDKIMIDSVRTLYLEKEDFKGDFHVIKILGDSVFVHRNKIRTKMYKDMLTGDKYAAVLSNYQWDILKGMWKQIAFSFFLFGITGTAFFFIMNHLKQQRRLANLKNEFISNMTHELKTPITTVGVALEALTNFNAINDKNKSQEYISISKKELNRLSILVDKVLKMSMFEKSEPELKLENVDMKSLINEVVNSMKLQFEKYKGVIELEFNGDGFEINGDKIHLTNLIYNLIDNALKYSPEDPRIHIKIDSHKTSVSLEIRDHGMGIPVAYQNKVFEKFFRVPTHDRHTIKGHGLGLSYVYSVVKKHFGDISFQSTEGKGSEFHISLPRDHG